MDVRLHLPSPQPLRVGIRRMAAAARHIQRSSRSTIYTASEPLVWKASRGFAEASHAFPDVATLVLFWFGAVVVAFAPALFGIGLVLVVSKSLAVSSLAAAVLLVANACWLKFSDSHSAR